MTEFAIDQQTPFTSTIAIAQIPIQSGAPNNNDALIYDSIVNQWKFLPVGGGGTGNLKIDGSNNMTADLNVGTHKIVNVVDPTLAQDAATKNYVDINSGGGTGNLKIDGSNNMTADLNVGTHKIVNVVDPISSQDAATKSYVDFTNLNFLKIDGSNGMLANLDVGHFVVNVSDPVSSQDAATKNYVDANNLINLKIDGSNSMVANLNVGTNKVINVGDPTNPQDAATKNYVDTNIIDLKIDGSNNMTANLNAGTHKVINVVDPTNPQDAATKNYVDTSTRYKAFAINGTLQLTTGGLSSYVNNNKWSQTFCPTILILEPFNFGSVQLNDNLGDGTLFVAPITGFYEIIISMQLQNDDPAGDDGTIQFSDNVNGVNSPVSSFLFTLLGKTVNSVYAYPSIKYNTIVFLTAGDRYSWTVSSLVGIPNWGTNNLITTFLYKYSLSIKLI